MPDREKACSTSQVRYIESISHRGYAVSQKNKARERQRGRERERTTTTKSKKEKKKHQKAAANNREKDKNTCARCAKQGSATYFISRPFKPNRGFRRRDRERLLQPHSILQDLISLFPQGAQLRRKGALLTSRAIKPAGESGQVDAVVF